MPNQYPEIYTQFLATSLIVAILIGFVVLLTVFYQKRKIQQQKEMELLKAEMEKEILSTRMEIQEAVQRDISMEIHDNVGQTLLLTNVNLTILANQIAADPDALQIVQECRDLVKKSLEDLTYLSRSMHPDRIVEIGFSEAIIYELEHLKRKNILDFTFDMDTNIIQQMTFKPNIQLLLFRIYQEGIKNILKYASASKVSLSIVHKNQGLVMLLTDNGVGFDPDDQRKQQGIGLLNMRRRVAIFNGTLDITSKPDKGTTVEVYIPNEQLTVN